MTAATTHLTAGLPSGTSWMTSSVTASPFAGYFLCVFLCALFESKKENVHLFSSSLPHALTNAARRHEYSQRLSRHLSVLGVLVFDAKMNAVNDVKTPELAKSA